jgi:hypothetical protein
MLVIVDDYSRSYEFCAWVICALTCFVGLVAYAYFEVCLSSIAETLGSLLQGELASLVEFDACFDLPWFRGSMIFCIEKSCDFLATLLSLKLGVCHPHCLV